MNVKIKSATAIPGVRRDFHHPSLVIFVEVIDKDLNGNFSRLVQIHRELGFELPKPIENSNDFVVTTAVLISKIFETLGFLASIPPKIEIAEKDSYKITFPRIEGCEQITVDLFTSLTTHHQNSIEEIEKGKLKNDYSKIIRKIKFHAPIGKNTLRMLQAAKFRGVPTKRLWGNVYQLGEGSALRWFDSSLSDSASSLTAKLLQNKIVTTSFLRDKKFPVPKNFIVMGETQAILKAEFLGYPVVMKPQNRDRGEGVTSLISTRTEVRNAFALAKKFGSEVIVEEFLEGRDFRIHVMNGRAYRVRERIPGGVIGNGTSTIKDLLEELNSDPKRGSPGSKAELIRIDIDAETQRMLLKQNLKLSDIPMKNQFVRLRSIANVSVGGLTNEFPLARVHPDNIALAESAVKAVNIDIAAVDFITPDIEISWRIAGGGICEINHKPQFGPDAVSYLFDEFFPLNGRIPSFLIVGDSCDFEFYKKLTNRLKNSTIRVGLATAAEAWVGENELPGIFKNGVFDTFSTLLQNREVDAIIVIWDKKIKHFGLPTPDLAALCLTGNIFHECTRDEIVDLSYLSRKILTTGLNRPYIDGAICQSKHVEIVNSLDQLDEKFATLIEEFLSENIRQNH